ncbi:MAG: diguanylate cyclase [Ruminococcus sp.]|nr:diguanylate cyclase [Ruminococcus sp.]
MFFNRFAVCIISPEKKIEAAFSSVPRPEDSVFELKTCSRAEEFSPSAVSGCAVIVDCSALNGDIPDFNAENAVLIISADAPPSDETLEKAGEVWVMPKDEALAEKLLKLNFKRLMDNMKFRADSHKNEVCFNTAIDSVPDLIWFKNSKGAHLIVNNSFCKAVEKTKEQIYKKGHYYIWDIPKSEYEQGDYVCLESEDIVVEARKTCLFDEKVKTKSGMRQFKTYKSPLIDSDGNIFGTCGIARDITDIQNTNNELDVVLESMPYAVIVADKHGSVISTNSKFSSYFPEDGSIIGENFESWKEKALAEHTMNADGNIEITKSSGDETKTLVFNEQPIIDVFNENIGTVNVFRDVTLERAFEQQTLQNANTDFLTGLHNRRSLFSYLRLVKNEPQLSLITIDLDNFKSVNDTFGHQIGDEALTETSAMIKKCFPNDFIARLGGDEFLVVISGICSESELESSTANLLGTLCGAYRSREEFSMMTASAGIAYDVIESGSHNIEKLMVNSDSALYCAKNSGKATYKLYGKLVRDGITVKK